MRDVNVTPAYILAGEATFTVSNGRGDHFTYHVFKAKPDPRYPAPSWFIKVMTGPDNTDTDSFRYLGRVIAPIDSEHDAVVKLTAKSKFREADKVVKVAKWAIRAVWQVKRGTYHLPAGYTIHHIGNCGRCGRPLTTPASLDTGLGPLCAAELGVEWLERDRQKRVNGTCERCGKRPNVGNLPFCHRCAQSDSDYATGDAAAISSDLEDTSHPGHPMNHG